MASTREVHVLLRIANIRGTKFSRIGCVNITDYAEINSVDQGFLIATSNLVVLVDSVHGRLQLRHALLIASLSQLSVPV